MAGNKRISSQMDNGNDNPYPNALDEYQASLYTDNLQDLFELPITPSDEDFAMLGSLAFQAAPVDDSNNNKNNNSTNIDPNNALVLQDQTQVIPVESAVAFNINEQATTENVSEPPKAPRKRRRKGDPEPDHSALVREKTAKSNRCGQACDRCHVSTYLYFCRCPVPWLIAQLNRCADSNATMLEAVALCVFDQDMNAK